MTLGDVGVVISCVGHLHSNSWRANLFEVRPLIINSFFSLHFKAALMLFEVRSLLEVLGYLKESVVKIDTIIIYPKTLNLTVSCISNSI